jgi:hypothetical protein
MSKYSKYSNCREPGCNGNSDVMGFCSVKHFNINLWLNTTREGN